MATTKRTSALLSTGTWELPGNATMRLPRSGLSSVVRVQKGTVLVTQEGDREDYVLATDDEIVLEGGGLAVAWAFTDAEIAVSEFNLRASNSPRSRQEGGRSRALTPAVAGVM